VPTALVVLSGGQDSTTCLYWALNRFGAGHVEAVTFDYGQRHRIELACAAQVAARAGTFRISCCRSTPSRVGRQRPDRSGDHGAPLAWIPATGLPNTFVPGRNLIFLTFAAALAYQRGIHDLVTGVAQTDYSGYPDCRQATLQALEQALRLGMDYATRFTRR
jgi:7-cyano-7-deazaguanine synthase